jgi:ABC-type multidrug transport system ATPase subunit
VAILNQGRLVFQGHWTELAQARKQFRLRLNDWEKARVAMEKCGAILVGQEIVELRVETEIADLIAELVRSGVRIHSVEPLRDDLEELYLRKVSAR